MNDYFAMFTIGLTTGWLSAAIAFRIINRFRPDPDLRVVESGHRRFAIVEITGLD